MTTTDMVRAGGIRGESEPMPPGPFPPIEPPDPYPPIDPPTPIPPPEPMPEPS